MHRVDTDGNVGGMYDPGDPVVPRLPTQIDHHVMNALQEEIVTPILEAGITLVKGTNTQLRDALRSLFVRVTGGVAQTITGVKTFTSKLVASDIAGGNGGPGVRALFEAVIGDAGASTGPAVGAINYSAGGGLLGSGLMYGVKGSSTSNGATHAGVVGSNSDGYGVLAEGKTASPARAAFRIVPQQAAPSSPQKGDLYVNDSDGKLYLYNGSAWVVVGTQT